MHSSAPEPKIESKPDAAVTLKESLVRLHEVSSETKLGAKAAAMKRPAASLPPADVPSQKSKQPPMKRPAASSDAAGKPKKMMKKPASFDAGSTSQPGPVPVGNGKKMPSKARRVELCPGGCSTCRFVPGHAPSCWVKKGWTV